MVTVDYRPNYEYAQRVPVAVIGGGDHYVDLLLPCLRYLPLDLVALADADRRRGMQVARMFGAQRFYPDAETLLGREEMRAVILSLPALADGSLPYPEIASAALAAGVHAWVDAPTASTASDITKQYTDGAIRGRSYLMGGYRRSFMPGYEALRTALAQSAIKPSAYSLWVALPVPPTLPGVIDQAGDLPTLLMHPLAVLVDTFGEAKSAEWSWHADRRGITVMLGYPSGLVGTLQLTCTAASTAPQEELMVQVGDDVWRVSQGLTLTQPHGQHMPDAGSASQTALPTQGGAGALAATGYLGSLGHFGTSVLEAKPVARLNVLHLLQMMTLQDTLRAKQERQWVSL